MSSITGYALIFLERLESPTVIECLPTLLKVKIYRYSGMGTIDVLVWWFANEYPVAVSLLDLVICLGDFHGAIRKIVVDVLAFVHAGPISHGFSSPSGNLAVTKGVCVMLSSRITSEPLYW